MNDFITILKYFTGGGIVALGLFLYNRIRAQAIETENNRNKIQGLEDYKEKMDSFLDKFNTRFDITADRFSEISGKLKDQAKDIIQLRETGLKFERTVERFNEKQDEIHKIVTDIRIDMAKNGMK